MKTTRIRNEDVKHNWYLIDAKGKRLGRLATEIAKYLMGKNKVTYSRDVDNGDGVIVINANHISFTGNKENKKYYSHSRYIGNLKETNLSEMLEKHPDRVIKHAVKGMLPKNKLGRQMIKRLKIYKTDKHKHISQQPTEIKI